MAIAAANALELPSGESPPRGFVGWGVTTHPGLADNGDMGSPEQDSSSSRRRFRIRVAGRLDEQFIDGAAEIEVGQSTCGSTLEGPFVDQSQLRGLLDRLWQLGIEVLGFETFVPTPTKSTAEHPSIPAAGRHRDS
mgnify:CR=1 FL=1